MKFRILCCLPSLVLAGGFVVHAQSDVLSHVRVASLDAAQDFRVSGDGNWLAFRVPGEGLESALYGVRSDGSAEAVLLLAETERIMPDYAFSSDGTHVLYRHGTDTLALACVAADGSSPPLDLSGALVADGSVTDFALAGERIAFRADKDVHGVFQLYSVALDGGAVTTLGPALPEWGDVLDFRVTPDATRVVFRADARANEVPDLYSVPSDGGPPPVVLNPFRAFAAVQADYAISHDSLGVVYRNDQASDDVIELYVARLDATIAPAKRSGTLVAGGDVQSFALSDDDQRIVFRADARVDGVDELFSVPTVGGTPVCLHAPLPADADVGAYHLQPSGDQVVYAADDRVDQQKELYLVPIDASAAPLRVHPDALGPIALAGFDFTPDGARLVYRSGATLFSTPSVGATPVVELADDLWPQSDLYFSPDGVHVLFESDAERPGLNELFSVAADGSGAPARVNGELVSLARHDHGWNVQFGQDGARVYYLAMEWPTGLTEGATWIGFGQLYGAPVGGGASLHLSRGPEHDVRLGAGGFELTSDGRRVVSVIGSDLCVVATDGRTPPVRLSQARGYPNHLGSYALSPDGAFVVYLVFVEQSSFGAENAQLWAAHLEGDPAPFRLDQGGLALDEDTFALRNEWLPFAIGADSRTVVFTRVEPATFTARTWCTTLDGSVPLHALSLPGEYVLLGRTRVTPDAERALYVSYDAAGTHLVSVRVDGSDRRVLLDPTGVGGGPGMPEGFMRDVPRSMRTHPASTRVVFYARAQASTPYELHSAPVDGSGPDVTLNAPLPPGGEVQLGDSEASGFQFTPDGSTIVYRADALTDGVIELFAAPADGSAPARRLNGALVTGGDVQDYALSPDSRWVAYRADQVVNGVDQLYLVPLDGSAAPRAISAEATPGCAVVSEAFGPDSAWLVYRAQSSPTGSPQLFAVRCAGGSAMRLDAPSVGGRGISDTLRFTSFARQVVFAGDLYRAGRRELVQRRIDGRTPLVRLNGPLVPGGGIEDGAGEPLERVRFEITRDDARVVYLAEESWQNRVMLYSSALQRSPLTKRR